MREILFRGKRINNGKWVYGSLYSVRDKAYIIEYNTEFPNARYFEVDPSTVGQYTGLTDKNGHMIFEGDVVKTHYINARLADFVEQIVFRNGRFCTKYDGFFNQLRDYTVQIINSGHNVVMDSIEVIGNIHDNSELLEDKL